MAKPETKSRKRKAAREYTEEARTVFGEMGAGVEVPRQGLLRQRFAVPAATHHLLTERQRTVLKGKVRMSRGWVRMKKIMEETGMTMEEFVAQLSVEELVKGKFRDKSGGFRGANPSWVPREFHRACLQELMRRGRDMWQKNYLVAIEAMTDIAAGRGPAGLIATPGERLKAAQFVVERMEGKIPERLVVTEEERWRTVLDGIVAEVPPEAMARGRKALEGAAHAAEEIMDAEVLYEDNQDTSPDPAPSRSRRRRK